MPVKQACAFFKTVQLLSEQLFNYHQSEKFRDLYFYILNVSRYIFLHFFIQRFAESAMSLCKNINSLKY